MRIIDTINVYAVTMTNATMCRLNSFSGIIVYSKDFEYIRIKSIENLLATIGYTLKQNLILICRIGHSTNGNFRFSYKFLGNLLV